MTIQDIQTWADAWDKNQNYTLRPPEETMKRYREFMETRTYPYTRDVVEFIMEKEHLNLTEETREYRALSTQVYLASKCYDDDIQTAAGRVKCTSEILDSLKHGQKVEFSTETVLGKSLTTFLVKKLPHGDIMFQKPRQRTRGYRTGQFLGEWIKIFNTNE